MLNFVNYVWFIGNFWNVKNEYKLRFSVYIVVNGFLSVVYMWLWVKMLIYDGYFFY